MRIISEHTFRFLFFLVVLAFAYWMELVFRAAWGWSPEFWIVTLISSIFFLDFWEFLPVACGGMWLLNWPPQVERDIFLVAAIVLLAFPLAKMLPLRPRAASILLSVLATICIAFATNPSFMTIDIVLFLKDLALSAVYAALLFAFLADGIRYRPKGTRVQRLPILT